MTTNADCADQAYWFLWYHNFLLPALILRVLYSLIRRKLLPYPNLEELRQHREEVIRAREFSAAITSRLVTAPTYDVQDVWSLIKDLNNKRKLRKAAKRENSDDSDSLAQDDHLSEEHAEGIKTSNDSTPPADDVDVKRTALKAVNDVADLHERVKKYVSVFSIRLASIEALSVFSYGGGPLLR